MKVFTKFILIIIVTLTMLTVTACDNNNPETPASDSATQTSVTDPNTQTSTTDPSNQTTEYNEQVDMVSLLKQLLSGYKADPYTYIPESMRPGYLGTALPQTTVAPDYSHFVSVSSIQSKGFGEQWHMITDNLEQSRSFFKALSVLDGLTSVSVASFENYIDKNPSDTAVYAFEHGEYKVKINFKNNILSYILEYQLSGHTAQIALTMNVNNNEKTTRIQLSDANALTYTVTENSYRFAIKYLGVRRAYFDISKDNKGKVSGHIYEYLTVTDKEIESAAEFYIDGKYASAVGSKASGIPGFTGIIAEVYDVKTGKMI